MAEGTGDAAVADLGVLDAVGTPQTMDEFRKLRRIKRLRQHEEVEVKFLRHLHGHFRIAEVGRRDDRPLALRHPRTQPVEALESDLSLEEVLARSTGQPQKIGVIASNV